MRVREVAVLRALRLLELGGLGGAISAWKSVKTTSSRISRPSSSNMRWPSRAVLDERILLRERAQVDALAHVVHRLEVLTPARVDDLQDHEPLELAHDRRLLLADAEALLTLLVLVQRVVHELVDELVAVEARPRRAAPRP